MTAASAAPMNVQAFVCMYVYFPRLRDARLRPRQRIGMHFHFGQLQTRTRLPVQT